MMLEKIQSSIRKHRLFLRGQHVLVAVSGGADSAAMLLALIEIAPVLRLKLTVAHLNHRIRGKAARGDAEFVRRLAGTLKIPFVGGEVDVPRLAAREGLSIEMAARKARYEFLVRTARKINADAIATAHTADDQAETILLKLGRGAGPRGLSGIPREMTMNGVRVVRPLLEVTRSEIETFLRERKQKWREDRTNGELSYLRNRVRHEILPMLESKLNPKIRETLVRTADIIREEDWLLDQMARKVLSKVAAKVGSSLRAPELARQPLALRRRAIALWLGDCGAPVEALDFDAIERAGKLAAQKKGSGEVDVSRGWIVKRRYELLEIVFRGEHSSTSPRCDFCPMPPCAAGVEDVRKEKAFPVNFIHPRHEVAGIMIRIPGRTLLKESGLVITTSLKRGLVRQANLRIGRYPAFASLRLHSSEKLRVLVRPWRRGDMIEPFGMKGSKKLQDVFVDEKVPADERKNVPVFECNGRIIWIPGYRVARGWDVKEPARIALQIRVERARKR